MVDSIKILREIDLSDLENYLSNLEHQISLVRDEELASSLREIFLKIKSRELTIEQGESEMKKIFLNFFGDILDSFKCHFEEILSDGKKISKLGEDMVKGSLDTLSLVQENSENIRASLGKNTGLGNNTLH